VRIFGDVFFTMDITHTIDMSTDLFSYKTPMLFASSARSTHFYVRPVTRLLRDTGALCFLQMNIAWQHLDFGFLIVQGDSLNY
jgi:hypothetical protein